MARNNFKDFMDRIAKSGNERTKLGIINKGKVLSYKDGIAVSDGLRTVGSAEVVHIWSKFEENTKQNENKQKTVYISTGLVFNLNINTVSIGVIDPSPLGIREMDEVVGTGTRLKIKFSPALLGRVINPLGQFLDKSDFPTKEDEKKHKENILKKWNFLEEAELYVETKAPGIILRQSVKESLVTGVKIIDSLIPIGRGQRELIIGDRKTGKTALAVDFIIQQSKIKDLPHRVFCIYVAIGQKQSSVLEIVDRLKETDSLNNTIIVAASAATTATLQYLAPYVGCSLGEYFRDRGQHSLVIYDDLTKHAVAYREISLSLRRPPGREAFPGDVFYIHSRLLERAAKLADFVGGGSLTAIPIVETLAGDVSAYIPTNVISITDGQIVLNSDLFNNGIRPAVEVGLSVSRVGSAAQSPLLKAVVSTLKLELAQYRDLSGFTKLGTELDEATESILKKGRIYEAILIQKPYKPLNASVQALLLTAAVCGYMDEIPVENIQAYEKDIIKYVDWVSANKKDPVKSYDYLTFTLLELFISKDPVAYDVFQAHESRELFVDTILEAFHGFLATLHTINTERKRMGI